MLLLRIVKLCILMIRKPGLCVMLNAAKHPFHHLCPDVSGNASPRTYPTEC